MAIAPDGPPLRRALRVQKDHQQMTLHRRLMLRLPDAELNRRAQKAMRRGDVAGQVTQEEIDWINRKLDRVNSRRDHPMLLRLPPRTSADPVF